MFTTTLLMLCLIGVAEAKSRYDIEMDAGSLTYHYFDSDDNLDSYKNKTHLNTRTMKSPTIGFKFAITYRNRRYETGKFFLGDDQMKSPMYGFHYATGLNRGNLQLGVFMGGHMYDRSYWIDADSRNRMSFHVDDDQSFALDLGLEINYTMLRYRGIYFKLNNLLGPLNSIHSISIGTDF